MYRPAECGNLVRVRIFGTVVEVALLEYRGQLTRERKEHGEAPDDDQYDDHENHHLEDVGVHGLPPWVGAQRPFPAVQK